MALFPRRTTSTLRYIVNNNRTSRLSTILFKDNNVSLKSISIVKFNFSTSSTSTNIADINTNINTNINKDINKDTNKDTNSISNSIINSNINAIINKNTNINTNDNTIDKSSLSLNLYSRVSASKDLLFHFNNWLKLSNIIYNNVTIKSIADPITLDSKSTLDYIDSKCEWGLFAANNIKKEDILIKLPYHFSIGITEIDLIDYPNDFKIFLSTIPKEWCELALGLRLLSERSKNDSKFSNYINALPLYFPGIPLFFTPNVTQSFCYSPLNIQLQRKLKYLSQIVPKLTNFPTVFPLNIDIHALAWAVSSTSSRAFSFDKHKVDENNIPNLAADNKPVSEVAKINKRLLPLIDMMNHSPDANVKIILSKDFKHVYAIATKDIKEGEELRINYGIHSCDEFLMQYGFLPDNTSGIYPDYFQFGFDWNMFELLCEICKEGWEIENFRREAIAAVRNETDSRRPFTLRPISHGGLDVNLLIIARILFAPQSVFENDLSKTRSFWQSTGCVDSSIERKAMEYVLQLLTLLSQYAPTSEINIDKDSAELVKESQLVKRLALTYRVGKKKILEEQIQFLSLILGVK